jgi:hypothetical protein
MSVPVKDKTSGPVKGKVPEGKVPVKNSGGPFQFQHGGVFYTLPKGISYWPIEIAERLSRKFSYPAGQEVIVETPPKVVEPLEEPKPKPIPAVDPHAEPEPVPSAEDEDEDDEKDKDDEEDERALGPQDKRTKKKTTSTTTTTTRR